MQMTKFGIIHCDKLSLNRIDRLSRVLNENCHITCNGSNYLKPFEYLHIHGMFDVCGQKYSCGLAQIVCEIHDTVAELLPDRGLHH